MLQSLIGYTVATLPAAAREQGNIAIVSDSTVSEAVGSGTIVVGGGVTRARVRSDGTAWRVYGATRKGAAGNVVSVFDFTGGVMPGGATLTRAQTGWYFDNTLTLQSAGANVPRFNYDPAGSGLQGLYVEPAATNSFRSNPTIGTVSGTPGTVPTNYNISTSVNGVTRTIVGFGTEDGIPYIDLQYQCAPSSAQSNLGILPETSGQQIVAAQGQQWIGWGYYRLMAGSLTGLISPANSMSNNISGRNAAGAGIETSSNANISPTGAALKTQVIKTLPFPYTLSNALSVFVTSTVGFVIPNAATMNFTVRFGAPQLLQGTVQTSPIITTTAPVTRDADVLTLTVPLGVYRIDIQRASGTTTLLNQFVNGTYVVPTDPSPLKKVTFS